MKKIGKVFMVLAVLLTAHWQLQAQRPFPGPPHRGPALEQFVEELGITDDQKAALQALREDMREEAEALRDQEFDSREARREAMQALRDNHRDAVNDILTEEQQAKLKALMEEKKAEQKADRQEQRENRKNMRAATETYRNEEILPVLREQRAKLETELSAEDKATVAELRAKREANRPERPNFEDGAPRKRPHLTEVQREAIREDRETIKGLVDKYDSQISALLDEIETERTQWREDMREIAEKYAPENRIERPRRGRRGDMKGRRPEGDRRMGKQHRQLDRPHRPEGRRERGEMGKAGFLLLDPNASAEAATTTGDFAEIRVFPNPAASRNTVNYELKAAGNYRVELRDKDGLVLRVVSDNYRQVGEYREELDVSDLTPGTYFLTITGAKGVVSKKIVITR